MSTNEVRTYAYPILSCLHEVGGNPNRQRILRTMQELTANAALVDSLYGVHGHTFRTMSPNDYQVLNRGIVFVMPVQPVPNPDIIAGATTAVIAETVRQHGVHQKVHAHMCLIQATLRKILLDSSDEIYWRRMHQNIILYSGRMVRELLIHMGTTYGTFTEAERCNVNSNMDVPWEGGPLETIIQQIQEVSNAFGLGGAALSDTQMCDKIYDLVSASNFLPEACQQWRMRPEIDKNWDNACTHFQQFANDRDQVQTAGGAGFHTNHIELALAANAEAMTDLNLQVANLSVSNTTQNTTIQELMTKLATTNAAHQAYRDTVTNNNHTNNGGRSGGYKRRPQQSTSSCGTKYCWSHGICTHVGTACCTPREGHQAAATLANRQGGSNMNCT
jgi:cell fate (sporulation/competence/biofilm development) regulator YlbF (YheA/YmcA/DUF963 family)